ncbi:MAG: PEP-CTERM sorting domain-containing protein [Planctomycetota bacterium]
MKKACIAACAALFVANSAFAQTELYSAITRTADGGLDVASTLIPNPDGGFEIISLDGDVTPDGDDFLFDGLGDDYTADTTEPFILLDTLRFVGGIATGDAAGDPIADGTGDLVVAFYDDNGDLFDFGVFAGLATGNRDYNFGFGDDFFIPSSGAIIFVSLPDTVEDANGPVVDATNTAVLFNSQTLNIGTNDASLTLVADDNVLAGVDVPDIDDVYAFELIGTPVSVIPEPATLGLAGFAALGLLRRRSA